MTVSDDQRVDEHFRPLRPAPRRRLAVAIVIGPVMWIVAFTVVAILVDRTNAIELGLLVAVAAGILAALVLSILSRARRREEDSYADGA